MIEITLDLNSAQMLGGLAKVNTQTFQYACIIEYSTPTVIPELQFLDEP